MPPFVTLHILKFCLTIVGADAERVELAGSHLGSVQDLGVECGGQAGHDQQPPGGHRPGHPRHPWWTHLRAGNLNAHALILDLLTCEGPRPTQALNVLFCCLTLSALKMSFFGNGF